MSMNKIWDCCDGHRAAVQSLSDVMPLIVKYEVETNSKFIVYYGDKSFGSKGN